MSVDATPLIEELDGRLKALEEKGKKSWWRTEAVVPLLTALLAIIIPVTTLIYQNMRSQTELSLAASDQANKIRMAYLNLITRSDLPDVDRFRLIRFLEKTEEDPLLSTWAKQEMAIMRKIVDERPPAEKQIAAIRDYVLAADSLGKGTGKSHPLNEEVMRQLESLVVKYQSSSRDAAEIRTRLEVAECEFSDGTYDFVALKCK